MATSHVLSPILGRAGSQHCLSPTQSLSSSGCYSLSVRLSRPASWDRVRHYRIQRLDNGWLYISPRLTFPSLLALVDHYSGTAAPHLMRVDGDLGSGGSQSSLGHFTCWRISRQERDHPFHHTSPCAKKRSLGAPASSHINRATQMSCGCVGQYLTHHCGSESRSPTAGTFSPQELGPQLLLLWNLVNSQHLLVPIL